MLTTLTLYEQDPSEVVSYDLAFADRLTPTADSIASWEAEVDAGMQLKAAHLVGGSVRAFIGGGISGRVYRLAADVITAAGQTLRKEINVLVNGSPITGAPITSPGGFLFLDGFAFLLDSNFLVLA